MCRSQNRTAKVARNGQLAALLTIPLSLVAAETAHGRNNIREAFFAVYPDAVGTTIETVPSHLNHCGVCHYDFAGGGARNPYGETTTPRSFRTYGK